MEERVELEEEFHDVVCSQQKNFLPLKCRDLHLLFCREMRMHLLALELDRTAAWKKRR